MVAPDLHLETERLILRALTPEDLDELATLLGDDEALVLWGGALDREGARAWIERNMARYASHGFGRCAVIWRETGELVGDCGLVPTLVEDVPEVELGWITRRDFWGTGVATEAGAAWRDHGRDVLGLERIVSMISAQNVASRRVAEKLGFAVEREAMWGDLPHLMYAYGRSRPTQPESSAARSR
jgi:[ribosomal protein S5]-alanine N-acetyltransferase